VELHGARVANVTRICQRKCIGGGSHLEVHGGVGISVKNLFLRAAIICCSNALQSRLPPEQGVFFFCLYLLFPNQLPPHRCSAGEAALWVKKALRERQQRLNP
jgi:hypothetical protein